MGLLGSDSYFIALKEKGKIGPGFKKNKKGEERKKSRMHSNPKPLGNWSERRSSAKNVKSAPQGSLSARSPSPCRHPSGLRGGEKAPPGVCQGSEPAAPHIKTPREPPQLPAGGRGQLGHWGPNSFPHRASCVATEEENPAGEKRTLQLTAQGREAELRNTPARALAPNHKP